MFLSTTDSNHKKMFILILNNLKFVFQRKIYAKNNKGFWINFNV